MKLMIATTVLVLTAGTTFAQDAEVKLPELSKPELAFLEAAAIADNTAEGDLIGMELNYIAETEPVYLADLESGNGFARLMIDGDNGDILVSETIDGKTEEALEAYLENFSTQAEIAEMAALQAMIDDEDLSEEEMEELSDMLEQVEKDMADEDADDKN